MVVYLMNTTHGKCRCGHIKLLVSLPEALESYSPRECDCDFCSARGIEYLSDPAGQITITGIEPLVVSRQGSDQAQFLSCNRCRVVVAVVLELENHLIGAVNAPLLDSYHRFGQKSVVSPRLLEANEKRSRWESIWSAVEINGQKQI